jgi:hypothetical protein
VKEFVDRWRMANAVGHSPMVGTPSWTALCDDDPAKLAAVLDAGIHHALRMDVAQQQMADASKDISATVDWSGVARQIQQRRDVYIRRAS